MKSKPFFSIIMLLAFSIFITGCATTQTDLAKNGIVTVTRLSSNHARIHTTHVSKRNDSVRISGHVKFANSFRASRQGHVDITIINPDSSILTKTTAATRHAHRPRNDNRPSPYSVTIPLVIPKGSEIQVIYHAGGVKPECTHATDY